MRAFRQHAQNDIWCSFFLWFSCLNFVLGQTDDGSEEGLPINPPLESSLVEPENVPTRDNFLRRADSVASHSSKLTMETLAAAVIGNYIYFDGGELSQNHTYSLRNPVNATLAIDLTKSWIAENVDIIETEYEPDSKQSLRQQVVLLDQSAESFYTWSGAAFDGHVIRALPELWKFEPDGNGSGQWRNETPTEENDAFFTLKRSRSAAYVSTPNKGFIFGGVSTFRTTPESSGPIPGYTTFDFKTRTWSHETNTTYSPVNTMAGGGAVFAPKFGPNGLVFVFGGVTHLDGTYTRDDLLDLSTLHFMDPVTNRWYSQATSGTRPSNRINFCYGAVAAGDGSRFDIFIYAGSSPFDDVEYSDVHVLSLPGFRWTKVSGASNADRMRQRHTCAVVGRRHLLSWGGYRQAKSMDVPDAFPQGIGLFDMTALEWTNSYDANAEPYDQHEDISSWYHEQDDDAMGWLSTEVRELFLSDKPSPSSLPAPAPLPSLGPTNAEATAPVGLIAGGAVGGVVIIAAVLGLLWFLRRKRRRKQEQDRNGTGKAGSDTDDTGSQYGHRGFNYHPDLLQSGPRELYAGYIPPELVADAKGAQYAADIRYEVDGTGIERSPKNV